MKNLLKVTIIYPSGNETALVEGIPNSREEKKKINDLLMSKFDSVEQVGFYDLKQKRLEMAGGEFCVNAARAFVYLLDKANIALDYIDVSGTKRKLRVGRDEEDNYFVEVPFITNEVPKRLDSGLEEILLEGISLLIIRNSKSGGENSIKQRSLDILKRYGYLEKYPAAGVIFLDKIDDLRYEIKPVIWVRDIQTCFFETACGSGTAAAGISEALTVDGNDLRFDILQPSGKYLRVNVKKSGDKIKYVDVSGEVELVKRLDFKVKI